MNLVKTIFLFICVIFACTITQAQRTTALFREVDTLNSLLSSADSLGLSYSTSEDFEDSVTSVNDQISSKLATILTNSKTIKLNLDSLLSNPYLDITHSKDKRLWIFDWFENTGGTWKSYLNVIQYRTTSKKPKVVYETSSEDTSETDEKNEQDEFYSNESSFEKIYKLNSKRNLYLCIGSGVSCTLCEFAVATVVELTKDSINFSYAVFPFIAGNDFHLQERSCFVLNARLGDIEKFKFDPKTQTLTYTYLTDDNTPVQSVKQKRITRKLLFNGTKFVWSKHK
jgi:hypothetical protein